jgi:hypothetical protein
MAKKHTSRLIIATALSASFAIIVIGVSAQRFGLFSRSQAVQPRVTNKTQSVRISNVRRLDNGDVEITWTNQSTNAIYAYTLVTNERPTRKGVTTFLTVLPAEPGESKSERIPEQNLKSGPATTSDGAGEIVFSALYLEGGIAEGDQRESEKLKRTMGGMKEQAKLVLEVLRDAGRSPEQDSGRLLDTIESRVASLSVKDKSAPSSKERDDGKAMANDRLLGAVKRLRVIRANAGVDVKAELAELITYYERLATKL